MLRLPIRLVSVGEFFAFLIFFPRLLIEYVVDNEEWVPKHVSALQQVQQFLVTLSQPGADGRVMVTWGGMV